MVDNDDVKALLFAFDQDLDDESWNALDETHPQHGLKQLLARIGNLRVSLPSPQLGKHDPYALRFVVLLALIGGLLVAGNDWKNRLTFALSPDAGSRDPLARNDVCASDVAV